MGFHTNLRLRLEDKQNRKFLAIPWVYEFYSNRVWTRSAERIANNTPTAKIRYTVQELLSFKEHLKQHHRIIRIIQGHPEKHKDHGQGQGCPFAYQGA